MADVLILYGRQYIYIQYPCVTLLYRIPLFSRLCVLCEKLCALCGYYLHLTSKKCTAMKKSIALLFCLITLSNVIKAQLTDSEIYDLKAGKVKPDTSYIYALPYSPNSKFLLIQAYNSKMSHAGELSLDFKMKPGSKICAAREGIVESIKEDSDRGGLKSEYMNDGNHIIIRHADGSIAMYWHLKKDGVLVNAGDTIKKGQHIGFSGNTGYSAFPHLHFQVQDKNGKDIPTRFYTKKGVKYLRPGKWHKAV